jgi:hypothetical protein
MTQQIEQDEAETANTTAAYRYVARASVHSNCYLKTNKLNIKIRLLIYCFFSTREAMTSAQYKNEICYKSHKNQTTY